MASFFFSIIFHMIDAMGLPVANDSKFSVFHKKTSHPHRENDWFLTLFKV